MSPELCSLFFECLDSFPNENLAQIEETRRFLLTGKKTSGSTRSRAHASAAVDQGILTALAATPFVLSKNIFLRDMFFSQNHLLKELGCKGILSSTVTNKLDYLISSTIEMRRPDRFSGYEELFDLSLSIISERYSNIINNQCIFSVFYFLFFVVKIFNETEKNSIFRNKIIAIWCSRIIDIASLKERASYLNSQLATIASYIGDYDHLFKILSDEDSTFYEIYQMIIYSNFKSRSFEFNQLLSGKVSGNKVTHTEIDNLFRYVFHSLKISTYDDECLLTMRLSWLNFILSVDHKIDHERLISIKKIISSNLDFCHLTNKVSKETSNKTWKLINMGIKE